VTIAGRATIDPQRLPNLVLGGLAGDDTFTIAAGHAFTAIAVQGGSPDASDVAYLTGDGTAVTLTLGDGGTPTQVTGGGLGTITLPGVEDVNLDAAGGNLTVEGTAADDDVSYTPTGADAGLLVKSGLNARFVLTNVDRLTIDGQGGDNTLSVHGTAGADTFTVDGTQVLLAGRQGVNAYANLGAVRVYGHESSDAFTVTAGATPIFVDGGDPIAPADGDTLRVTLAAAAAVTASMGPEADEGSFVVGANAAVSFDRLEGATVTGVAGSTLTVRGTNADNDIALVGTGADDFTVSVDGGPAVQYENFAAAALLGLAGDDEFALDINTLSATVLTVDGGQPSTAGDTVTVTGRTGVGATNAATWSPTAGSVDDGVLEIEGLTGGLGIVVLDMERLVYDGEEDNETLTVVGPAGVSARLVPRSCSDWVCSTSAGWEKTTRLLRDRAQ
jgi:hypothetical protein